jgi:hypothetical protein
MRRGCDRALFAAAALALLACACAARPDGRLGRHADPDVWTSAAVDDLRSPEQVVPEVALLAATPLFHQRDRELSRSFQRDHRFTGGSTTSGDAVAFALGAGAFGWTVGQWCDGDDARSLEVGVETIATTELITEALKETVKRNRPNGSSSTTSFPSGHASFSFATATFLARSVEDGGSEPWRPLAWLLYLPAGFVALNRVETGRHFPSDVAAGALIGVLDANLVYDAHFGDRRNRDDTIFQRRRALSTSLAPWFDGDSVGLELTVRF